MPPNQVIKRNGHGTIHMKDLPRQVKVNNSYHQNWGIGRQEAPHGTGKHQLSQKCARAPGAWAVIIVNLSHQG